MTEYVLIKPDGEHRVSLIGGFQPCYTCDMEGCYEDEELGGIVPCQDCKGAGIVPLREGVGRSGWEKLPPVNNPAMYDRPLL